MAKINLLPSERTSEKKSRGPALSVRTVLWFLLAANIIVILASLGIRVFAWQRLKGMGIIDSEYQQASAVSRKIQTIKQEQNKLTQELGALEKLAQRNVLWSEELSRLPQIMPEEVWLTSFSFRSKSLKGQEDKTLYLKGGLRPPPETIPMVVLSKLINQLKEDPLFSADFDAPVLTESKTEKRDTEDIMTFAIEMSYKQDTGK